MSRRRVGTLLAVLGLLVGAGTVRLVGTHQRDSSSMAVRIAASTPSVPGLRSEFLRVGGVRRHYLLYVPPARGTGQQAPAPLVLAFHGLHLSAAWIAGSTGLLAAAERAGVVLALPDAEHGAWNDGRLGPSGPDDVGFATALVDTLVRDRIVDPHRVTVSGYSNGAELALVLASRYPARVDAVVSVSGALPALPGAPRPHSPIPAWFTHGTADPVQPWGGRPTRNRLHPALLSEDATVDAFITANHAAAQPHRTEHGRVEQLAWPAGPGGAPVTLYRLIGAGHGWPTAPGTCGAPLCGGRLDAASLVVSVAVQEPGIAAVSGDR